MSDTLDRVLEEKLQSAYWHGELKNKNGVLQGVHKELKLSIQQSIRECLPVKLEQPKQYLREHTQLQESITEATIKSRNQAIDEIEARLKAKGLL